MICGNMPRFAAVRTLVLAALFAIGLVATTPVPALAGKVAGNSGTWANTGSLNTARTAHTATLLPSSQVLVVEGYDAAGTLTSAELYNPATGKWTVTGSTATPRIQHTATLLPNGEVLVAGGWLGSDPNPPYLPIYTATAELYNTFTGQWRTTGSMTTPRARQGATLLQNGQVLVAGGVNVDGSAGTTAELYNPSTGTWKAATGSMPSAQASPATLLLNGQVLVAGGDTAELYDPSKGQWTLTPNLYYGSSTGISTALLTNGDVLIYGNKYSCYASEFYNPVVNTWTGTMGQCGNAISFGPLALLGTGKVLLAGGVIAYSGQPARGTTNCRLYDPKTNTWLLTGSLKQVASHTATRLLNGQVLAVGGTDAELYTP